MISKDILKHINQTQEKIVKRLRIPSQLIIKILQEPLAKTKRFWPLLVPKIIYNTCISLTQYTSEKMRQARPPLTYKWCYRQQTRSAEMKKSVTITQFSSGGEW